MNNYKPILPHIIPQKQVICGFTTRDGGVSPPPFNFLNLGFKTLDDPRNIGKNHRILYQHLNVDKSHVALMEQIHGDTVSVIESGGKIPLSDGLITSKVNLMLGVLVADCIPLLLFDPSQHVIGAIHCGWRSISACIAEKALGMLTEEFGSYPGNVVAILGPSAGSCCYKVGEDVAELFHDSSVIKRDGILYADLKAELSVHLLKAGVRDSNIEIISDCTICNEHLFFSHRRNNKYSGRMMGYIMMKDN
jgi:YfiH family protein